jgi:hypothetical protein
VDIASEKKGARGFDQLVQPKLAHVVPVRVRDRVKIVAHWFTWSSVVSDISCAIG